MNFMDSLLRPIDNFFDSQGTSSGGTSAPVGASTFWAFSSGEPEFEGSASSPASAVHKLPIQEWHSRDEVGRWSVARLKREAEKAGIKPASLTCMEKNELVTQVVDSWGGSSGNNCVVCLNDYEEEDVLRVLPCKHRFHLECIDRWLLAHSCCCPLCNQKIS